MFPKKVLLNIEATPSCPAACYMCPRDLVKDKGFMKLETMEKIIDQVDPGFVWEVNMAGRGEPTIHPQFSELATIMRRSKVTTSVVTTGVSFTDANIESCANSLDVIRLSVSSINQATFSKVHIGLNFQKIWRNIEALAEAAAHKTVIHLTGGPKIYDHLPETVAHLRKLGFNKMHLLALWNRGGVYQTDSDNVRRKQLIEDLDISISEKEVWSGIGKVKVFTNILLGKLRNKNYCPLGDSSVSISYDGKILGCFQDFGHISNVGHIDVDHIRDVIVQRVKTLGNMAICHGCDALKVAMFK